MRRNQAPSASAPWQRIKTTIVDTLLSGTMTSSGETNEMKGKGFSTTSKKFCLII